MSLKKQTPSEIQEMLEPLSNGGFLFACHPGVPCFTECCRDLNLLLTPYDILRLKNHLGLEADRFLDEYTDVRLDEDRNLPMIYLRMQENERKTCPFVSAEGCRVYLDRPAACRTYPLARASRKHRLHGTVLENYFVLRESHCRGFEEERFFSVDEWIEDQGLEPYHEMNNSWMEIVTHPKLRRGLPMKQQQMFFMASYNLDQFRRFIFQSRFLRLFDLKTEEVEEFRENDEALLRFAYRWLRFSFLNEPTIKIRKEVEEERRKEG
jgi:Fe-S-cluster containining protein